MYPSLAIAPVIFCALCSASPSGSYSSASGSYCHQPMIGKLEYCDYNARKPKIRTVERVHVRAMCGLCDYRISALKKQRCLCSSSDHVFRAIVNRTIVVVVVR